MRVFLLLACLLIAMPAHAHVTANPDTGMAGAYFEAAFRVSHGCNGSDTIEVVLQLPPGMVVVKPQAKPGWKIEISKSKLAKPVPAGHGKMAIEQIDRVVWRGGVLPAEQYDNFGLLMKLPDAAGKTLWFPVTQTCKDGSHEWAEIPAEGQEWHDVKSPAPFVKIAPTDKGHAH
jgi:periplasmic copper chaperone A